VTYSEKIEVELTWESSGATVRMGLHLAIFGRGIVDEDFARLYPQHIDAAKRVYDANRELMENETRADSARWRIGTMRVDGGELVITWPNGDTRSTREELVRFHAASPERLAYFDKHCTKPLGEDEIEHEGERLRFERAAWGRAGTLDAEIRAGYEWFSPFYSGTALSPKSAAKARAWWRANVELPEGYEFDDERGARKITQVTMTNCTAVEAKEPESELERLRSENEQLREQLAQARAVVEVSR
jgi:DNA gyrase/topoisomerase IV subunit A